MTTAATSLRHLGAIDRTADRPPYRQISDKLRSAITLGHYDTVRDQLPSESALANYFGVARMTVRHAIGQLRVEGLVYSEHGRGVFVHRRNKADSPIALDLDDVVALAEFVERLTGQALTPYQSSALKRAYQTAQVRPGGATLPAVVECLGQQ